MRKYRILHVMSGYGGGVASHVINIIHGMDNKKMCIDIAAFTDYPDYYRKEVEKSGGKIYRLTNVRVKDIWGCIIQFSNIIQKGNYDVVHLHVTDLPALYFSTLSRLNGIKRIIVHAHISSRPDENTLVGHLKYALFRKITVLAATDLASCSKIASSFRFGEKYTNNHRVMHIPNSIDTDKYFDEIPNDSIIQLREEIGIEADDLVIGHVGYFGYQKNHPFMLQLIQKLKHKGIKFVWLFVGDGPDLTSIKNMAREMGISEHIRFLGRRSDVERLYRVMDIAILPSHYEGLPTVAVEAQAAGTPIVVSDAVTDECDMKLGIFYRLPLQDISTWADAIIGIGKNKKRIPASTRFEQIDKLGFTLTRAADLYYRFINGEIKSYDLGDSIRVFA